MKLSLATSVSDYRNKVDSLLLKKECCNNLILGLLGNFQEDEPDCYLGYVERDGEVIYAFMQTPPHNWILADVESVEKAVLEEIASFIYDKDLHVPGVLGPDLYVERFVSKYENLSKRNANLHMNELIYQLDLVQVEIDGNGQLVQASNEDYSLIKSWLIQFGIEARVPITEQRASILARTYLENGSVYLWKLKNRAVSMVNKSRQTKHGATVNAVFTPDEFKRNGYATNVVAALSQKLLDEGLKFCSLYTDRSNPTSNSIYKKIGYKEVGTSIVYHFEKID
ncbi:GNAT family N-acetyltransferase [Oceanobacillus chungangensis]|uniref:GNAT family N-acetyltransferase n=1 Tax=Oceanobacillus chungangensis TaxID=1229152 RepID=A0A3D8PWT4_9BACI|nr:GNAT family N-acetyltransferase [Oceanobacillus chungangensis]RDW20484.1 GNAT family N-acetyltransferase [Oceanobacillus chungangensis]